MRQTKLNIAIFIEKYSTYCFEDFLQDDYFILSVRKPSYNSILLWTEFVDSNPDNIGEYHQAKEYITSLTNNQNKLSEEEVFGMWKNIEIANKKHIKYYYRKNLWTFAAVAASVAILVVVLVAHPYLQREQSSELMSFVEKAPVSIEQDTATKLILSDKQTINLTEIEAEVTYKGDIVEFNNTEEAKIDQTEERESFNQIIVPKGKRATLSLSDGTKIWVNSGTKVIYPAVFSKKKREIYVDGEIYVEVTRNEQSPFVVKTSGVEVEVLGTSFNVNAYRLETTQSIVLVSGSVKVVSDSKQLLLKPNEKYENEKGRESVQKVDTEMYTSWVRGMYVYESELLEVILNRLSKYYGLEIICDKEASFLRFSGKLDLKEDLFSILTGMEKTAPISVQENSGRYVITLK